MYPDVRFSVCPFKECTYGQLLDEQERLISGLDLKNSIYFGSPPSKIVPMQGHLPEHTQEMIGVVRGMREQLRCHLDEYPVRGGDGSILN